MHDSLASQPRARKEWCGLGTENGLRGRELSQESRIPRQQGIKIVPSGYMSLMRQGLLVRLKNVEVVSVFTA